MRISDWSSDVCSSDLEQGVVSRYLHDKVVADDLLKVSGPFGAFTFTGTDADSIVLIAGGVGITPMMSVLRYLTDTAWAGDIFFIRSEEHTSELQSLMRISYAVFCLNKKNTQDKLRPDTDSHTPYQLTITQLPSYQLK